MSMQNNKITISKNIIDKITKIVSSENVLTEMEERYVYAQDATNKQTIDVLPDLVVFVETVEQVQQVVKIA